MPEIIHEHKKSRAKSKQPKEFNFVLKVQNPEGAACLDGFDQILKNLGLQTVSGDGRRNGKLKQAIVEQILRKEYPEQYRHLEDFKRALSEIIEKIDTYDALAFAYFSDEPFVWSETTPSETVIRMSEAGLVPERGPKPSDYGLDWDTE